MSKPNPQAKTFSVANVKREKVQPFGAHFTTKLEGVNSKLICALSLPQDGCYRTGCDDMVGDCFPPEFG